VWINYHSYPTEFLLCHLWIIDKSHFSSEKIHSINTIEQLCTARFLILPIRKGWTKKQRKKMQGTRPNCCFLPLISTAKSCLFQHTVCKGTIHYWIWCAMKAPHSTCALWRANTVHVLYKEEIQYMCSIRRKYSTCALWRESTVYVLYEEKIQYMCSMMRKYSTCALWWENTVHVLYNEKIQYMCSMKRKYSTCALWRESTVHVLYEEKIQYMCNMKQPY
jgi:hypothetical protein